VPTADAGVQAVNNTQVTISHPPGGRLPLLSAMPVITVPAAEHHHPMAGTKLYCLVTEANRCEQLAQVVMQLLRRVGFEPKPVDRKSNTLPIVSPCHICVQ